MVKFFFLIERMMTLDKLFKNYDHNFHPHYEDNRIEISGFNKRTLSVAGIECIVIAENKRIRTQGVKIFVLNSALAYEKKYL